MWTLNSDLAWKKWGRKEPYYGVLSQEQYRNENLTQRVYDEFFESGETYVKEIFSSIGQFINEDFAPGSVLDFGCGAGRLVIPFSKRAAEVTGMDISRGMLDQAEKNCRLYRAGNVKFLVSDDRLTGLDNAKYDLVNSYIVLQHINSSRGKQIFKRLMDSLKPGAVGVIHLVFRCKASGTRKIINYLRYRVPYLHNIANVFQGRSISEPMMQMNSYNMNDILSLLCRNCITEVKMKFTNHSGHLGAILIFRKPKSE